MHKTDIDDAAAVKRVMELMAIRGRSGCEREALDRIRRELIAAGAKPGQFALDNANRKSPHQDGGGNSGNLVFKLPGTLRAPRRMLSAHADTVPLCEGSKPVRHGDRIVSADRSTALGGDDRAGCAVILTAALSILKRRLPHPPLTFLWTVQEEVGPYGARFASLPLLGGPKLAFNWDGGGPNRVVTGATGACGMDIGIRGLASHAGCSPEQGVSAAVIFGLAIADLRSNGWHGLIMKHGVRGTSNVGVVDGGDATNVVMDRMEVRAEARAHDPRLRTRIVTAYRRAFERAARGVRSADGTCGRVDFKMAPKYEAFKLMNGEPCVIAAERAVRAAGLEPCREIASGGLDANWLTSRGIPTVTLGAGMRDVHKAGESLVVSEYLDACAIALRLATEIEGTRRSAGGRQR